MYFNFKKYQTLKFKNYFKNKSLFIFFHCVPLNSKEWVKIEQQFKKFNITYYTPLNKNIKELKTSIFSNYSFLMNGKLLFINFKKNNINELAYFNNSFFVVLCFKINNKIYFSRSKFPKLSYKKNIEKYHQVCHNLLKVSYKLTQQSK